MCQAGPSPLLLLPARLAEPKGERRTPLGSSGMFCSPSPSLMASPLSQMPFLPVAPRAPAPPAGSVGSHSARLNVVRRVDPSAGLFQQTPLRLLRAGTHVEHPGHPPSNTRDAAGSDSVCVCGAGGATRIVARSRSSAPVCSGGSRRRGSHPSRASSFSAAPAGVTAWTRRTGVGAGGVARRALMFESEQDGDEQQYDEEVRRAPDVAAKGQPSHRRPYRTV